MRLYAILAAVSAVLQAQTVALAPKNPSVAVNGTIQFTATVTGTTSAVTWMAGGVAGGNATVGTISSTGLYKAPANLPGQNPVQITAKAGTAKASTYVNILAMGPTITSVSPNPLGTGTVNVSIQGSGFQAGATVMIGTVQMSTLTVAPGVVTATGYQPPSATSATFCVKNPGSICSNTLTIPVSSGPPPPTTYALTVVNGKGSGNYTAGKVVNISANAAPSGQVFSGWTGAPVANANSASTTLTMPAANTTVTANYAVSSNPTYTLTVVNGTGSGNYTAGTVVNISANAAPSGQVFSGWTGAAVANANSAATTLTMSAANTTVSANYAVPPPATIPYPVTTHPRLWVTQNDLPRLRSWAVSTNPVYQQGMLPLLQQAVNYYQTQFFPGGVANPNYPDPGDVQGYSVPITEQVGTVLAFHSLIDPNPAARIQYAQYTRNLLMYAMNQAALGHLANAPFRDPSFAIYNRANGSGEQWPLMVDWIYNAVDAGGNPILTASDKATIRNVFMMWANDCLNASTTGGDHPSPVGVTNDPQLLPGNRPYRMAANNYYLGHARLLTMMALAMDPQDDPAVNASQPPAALGNSLRSYILNANGAWLYQEYAMFGDGPAVASAYGIAGGGAGFGLASGGLPPEGMLYGLSYASVLSQLLALQTAGFNNAAYSGPQIGLIGAPMWDRHVAGFLSSFTPAAQTFAQEPWLGPVYQFGSYGDLLRLYAPPDFMEPFALLALLDQQNGQTNHLNAARWMAVNGVEGGAGALMARINQPWSWSTTLSLLYFMLLDPAAAAPTDPRPALPATFVDPAAGRVVSHSDWSATNTMFDYRASWISINHQLGDGGQFELYRKGEWLTKEMSNYDNNALGMTTYYHNTLALKNACTCPGGQPSDLQWYEAGEWTNGSQWMEGDNAGDPSTVTSTGPGYVYASSDLKNLYNRPNQWTPANSSVNITQATRSIVWLNNDYIVVYDRATSLNTGLFKRFNLSLVTNPSIQGNTAVETLASGQQLFVQTLLPLNASIAARYALGDLSQVAELEPTQYVMTVQDLSNPVDTRFLHVLQGADAGSPMAAATYVKSTAGVAFDGAVFGSSAVYFPVNAGGGFTGTSLPAPAGVHTMLVAGLSANAPYGVSVAGGVATISAGGSDAVTDGAGLLRVVF
jgi:hypothetical protein